MNNVVISPNIKKTSVRIDASGNEIHPITKQIINPVEPAYVPPQKLETPPMVEPKSLVINAGQFNFCPNCGHKLQQ